MAVSSIAFCLTLPHLTPSLPLRLLWLVICVLGFYRSLLFVHELAHLRSARLRAFRWVWNALCGSMFFLPEFTYTIHSFHHLTSTFSTNEDPEYVPIAYQKPFELLAPFIIFPFAPLAIMLRFLVAAPLSWITGGRFREALLRHASSLKMNPKFEWKAISREDRRLAVTQEAGCLIWWSLFVSIAFAAGEPRIILHWYVAVYCILTVNHIRAMVAHGYINLEGERVTHEQQLLDSITIESPRGLGVGSGRSALSLAAPSLPDAALSFLRQGPQTLARSIAARSRLPAHISTRSRGRLQGVFHYVPRQSIPLT